jgi:hypothetical protein
MDGFPAVLIKAEPEVSIGRRNIYIPYKGPDRE